MSYTISERVFQINSINNKENYDLTIDEIRSLWIYKLKEKCNYDIVFKDLDNKGIARIIEKLTNGRIQEYYFKKDDFILNVDLLEYVNTISISSLNSDIPYQELKKEILSIYKLLNEDLDRFLPEKISYIEIVYKMLPNNEIKDYIHINYLPNLMLTDYFNEVQYYKITSNIENIFILNEYLTSQPNDVRTKLIKKILHIYNLDQEDNLDEDFDKLYNDTLEETKMFYT